MMLQPSLGVSPSSTGLNEKLTFWVFFSEVYVGHTSIIIHEFADIYI